VARNRKRAKERQARRRQPVGGAPDERDDPPAPTRHAAPDVELAEAQLALGRPELIGEPDGASEPEDEAEFEAEAAEAVEQVDGAAEDEFETDELDEDEFEAEEDAVDFDGGGGGRGPRALERPSDGGGDAAAPHPTVHKPRLGTRLIHFLQGSWRELQRVQWPDRRQVVQATAVVIGFVIVAGVYLGLADEVASKLVNFVLK
jgi:preprotein translocase subunit SecE